MSLELIFYQNVYLVNIFAFCGYDPDFCGRIDFTERLHFQGLINF